MLVLSFLQRGLGFISTLILARLLTPEDYGVIAIIYLVVFLADALSDIGGVQYIIQKENITDEDLNTAWTINLLLKTGFYLVTAMVTPFIVSFLDVPELLVPILVTLLILPLNAIANPGEYLYHKTLELKSFFWMSLIARVSVFIITVIMAYLYRNYWALIFGTLASYFLPALGTYFIHSFRPRLSLVKFKEQWRFSQWVFFNSFVGYVKSQIDVIFISKFFSPADLGGYNMMKNLAKLPDRIIIAPLASTFLSTYSNVKNEREKLDKVANISVIGLCVLLCPLAAFLYYNSTEVITVLLGKDWLPYTDVFKILVITLVTTPIAIFARNYNMAFGSVKSFFLLDLLIVLLSAIVYVALIGQNIYEYTCGYLFISIVQTIILLLYFRREIALPAIFPLFNVILITAISFICAHLYFSNINSTTSIMDLILSAPYFLFAYSAIFIFIYIFKGISPAYFYIIETTVTTLKKTINNLKPTKTG